MIAFAAVVSGRSRRSLPTSLSSTFSKLSRVPSSHGDATSRLPVSSFYSLLFFFGFSVSAAGGSSVMAATVFFRRSFLAGLFYLFGYCQDTAFDAKPAGRAFFYLCKLKIGEIPRLGLGPLKVIRDRVIRNISADGPGACSTSTDSKFPETSTAPALVSTTTRERMGPVRSYRSAFSSCRDDHRLLRSRLRQS